MPDIITLKPEQYPVLKGLADGLLPPEGESIAAIATDDNAIVGRVFVICPAHAEGIWVREDKRKSGLGSALMGHIEQEVKQRGASKLFAYAVSEYHERQLDRLGYKKEPMSVWSKGL